MSKDESTGGNAAGDALAEVESKLGQVLALIHRVLPRLEDSSRAADVQTSFQKAAVCLESARQAHQQISAPAQAAAGFVPTRVAAETVAIISAAVAAVLDRPY